MRCLRHKRVLLKKWKRQNLICCVGHSPHPFALIGPSCTRHWGHMGAHTTSNEAEQAWLKKQRSWLTEAKG